MRPWVYRAGPRWQVWKYWYATQPTAFAPKFVKGEDGLTTCTVEITAGTWVRARTRRGVMRKIER